MNQDPIGPLFREARRLEAPAWETFQQQLAPKAMGSTKHRTPRRTLPPLRYALAALLALAVAGGLWLRSASPSSTDANGHDSTTYAAQADTSLNWDAVLAAGWAAPLLDEETLAWFADSPNAEDEGEGDDLAEMLASNSSEESPKESYGEESSDEEWSED